MHTADDDMRQLYIQKKATSQKCPAHGGLVVEGEDLLLYYYYSYYYYAINQYLYYMHTGRTSYGPYTGGKLREKCVSPRRSSLQKF